ncbi:hypothetical protein [Micromonospora zamorensis]|uniref:hypothetical protein n=1 Tax=Micromonospora zamorensis TaxID=709883 RepID=UPI00378C3379
MPRRKAGKRAERPDDRDGVQAGREIMSESAQQRGVDRNVESGDPDVLLDIPKVSVDSIRLAVDGLDADLSLRARVANLLQVDAGVRVHLNGGELDINGVHAEAQLRVRLEQLTRILGRALDTLDANPQIIEALARTAVTTVDDVNRSAQQLAPGSMGAAEVRGSARRSNGVLQEFGQQVGAVGAVADRAQPGPVRSGPGAGRPGPDRPGRSEAGPGGQGPGGPGAGPGRSEAGPGGPGAGSGWSEATLGGPGAGPGRPGAGPGGAAKGSGGPGPHAGGPGPSAGGPGSQAGGPGLGEKAQPESGGPQGGRAPEGRPHEEPRRPEGQRHEEPRHPEGQRHGERHHPEGQRPAAPGDGKRPAGADRGAEGPAGSSTGERGNRPDQSAGPGPSPSGDRDGGGGLLGGAQSAAQLAEQAGETLRQAGRSVWEAIQSGVAQHRQQGRRDE